MVCIVQALPTQRVPIQAFVATPFGLLQEALKIQQLSQYIFIQLSSSLFSYAHLLCLTCTAVAGERTFKDRKKK